LSPFEYRLQWNQVQRRFYFWAPKVNQQGWGQTAMKAWALKNNTLTNSAGRRSAAPFQGWRVNFQPVRQHRVASSH